MRRALAVATGVVLFVAAMVITAPAALLDERLAALSDGRIRMGNAAGTLWNGSGELAIVPAGSRQPLHWRLEALPLLRGETRVAFDDPRAGAPSATLAYGRDRFELRNLDFSLPVEDLLRAASGAKIAPDVGGNLRLHVDHLLQQSGAVDAQLTVRWDDASVPALRTASHIALGTVRLDLNGRGSELAGPLRNAGGEVEIVGQLTLGAAGAARLEATLRPRGTTRERTDIVAAALSTLGAADGQGGYRVNWAGTWR